MTNESLGRSYLRKADDRLNVLDLLVKEGGYSDVVREAPELVELAFKGMLRAIGIEPPKLHDVGALLLQHRDRFAPDVQKTWDTLAGISKELRKDRELAFYGDIVLFQPRNIRWIKPSRNVKEPQRYSMWHAQ